MINCPLDSYHSTIGGKPTAEAEGMFVCCWAWQSKQLHAVALSVQVDSSHHCTTTTHM